MNKQALRNLLRRGGVAFVAIGFILGRTTHNRNVANAARGLIWIGLAMIIGGIIVRLSIAEP